MMRKIEQLEEVQKICKPMGHQYPNHPLATCKPAAADARPASWPQINLISPQMETLQRILNSNGAYGPPPKQPVHNSQLRAGFRRLCKYNFDRKDYANKKTKTKQNKSKQNKLKRRDGHNKPSPTIKDEILVKPTMAMPTNNPIKPTESPDTPTELLAGPTEITRRKPDENAKCFIGLYWNQAQ
jgi:hypothetical protein